MRVFSHVVGVIPWFESTHWEISMPYFGDIMCIPRFQRIRTEANKEITVSLLNDWHERVFSFVAKKFQQIKMFPYQLIISCPFRLVISINSFKFILQFYSLDDQSSANEYPFKLSKQSSNCYTWWKMTIATFPQPPESQHPAVTITAFFRHLNK